jgi:hypothetical protein
VVPPGRPVAKEEGRCGSGHRPTLNAQRPTLNEEGRGQRRRTAAWLQLFVFIRACRACLLAKAFGVALAKEGQIVVRMVRMR